jgi:hypothetical protein
MMKYNNGYDDTKKMLNTLRKLNESQSYKNTIREQHEFSNSSTEQNSVSQQNVKNDITVINDVDVKLLSNDSADMKLTDEQQKSISGLIDNFKQQVSDLVEFRPGIVVDMQQIRLDGTLPDTEIKFTYIAGKDLGIYLNCDMLKITPDVTTTIEKLGRFYMTFTDTMNNIITSRQNN